MVDMRFGHGTWAGIIAERAKRIQERREAEAAARRNGETTGRQRVDGEGVKQFRLIGVIIANSGSNSVCLCFLMVSVAIATVMFDAKEITENNLSLLSMIEDGDGIVSDAELMHIKRNKNNRGQSS